MTFKQQDLRTVAKRSLDSMRSAMTAQQNIFAVIAGIFGLLFLLSTPPMQSPDESEHLYRAYQVSQFNVVADPIDGGYGGVLPTSLIEASRELKASVADQPFKTYPLPLSSKVWHTPLEPSNQSRIRFDNTAIYSPVPYLPQAFGVGLGRMVHANPLAIIYLGRIANLVAWIAIMYWAIRLTPIGKWVFVVIALNPTMLFLTSTMSSDAMTTGLVALLVAAILRLRATNKPLGWRQLIVFGALVVACALIKNAYLPVVFLALSVPVTVLRNSKKITVVCVALAIGMAWNIMILPIAQNIVSYFGMDGTAIATGQQVKSIIHHPQSFVEAVSNAMFGKQNSPVLVSYNGVVGDTASPYWLSLSYFMVLVAAILYRSEAKRLYTLYGLRLKLLFVIVIAMSIAVLFGSLYTGYTKVGSNYIDGIQGRYFIPLTFLLVPVALTQSIRLVVSRKVILIFIPTALSVILSGALLSLLVRYY